MKRLYSIFWIWFLVLPAMVACSSGQADSGTPRVVGALDVLPLVAGIQEDFIQRSGMDLETSPSTDGVQEVREGEAQALIIGREPTPEELEGMESYLVAYDAVCFLINTRTYEGGIQVNQTGPMIEYQRRTKGLQGLTWMDIKNHLANVYRTSADQWLWNGVYDEFILTFDQSGRMVRDPVNQAYTHGSWVRKPVFIFGEAMQAGKFDTQDYLFQLLGWDQSVLETPDITFIPSIFESEEEVISFRFILAPPNPNPENGSVFNFYLLPASRQVAVRALEQGFALRPIRINGTECIGDPSDIYSGKYPLSRKVYLLASSPLSPEINQLVEYLLSPDGQERIRQLSFIPLPADQQSAASAP